MLLNQYNVKMIMAYNYLQEEEKWDTGFGSRNSTESVPPKPLTLISTPGVLKVFRVLGSYHNLRTKTIVCTPVILH